jgi:hypothetical protein
MCELDRREAVAVMNVAVLRVASCEGAIVIG